MGIRVWCKVPGPNLSQSLAILLVLNDINVHLNLLILLILLDLFVKRHHRYFEAHLGFQYFHGKLSVRTESAIVVFSRPFFNRDEVTTLNYTVETCGKQIDSVLAQLKILLWKLFYPVGDGRIYFVDLLYFVFG